LRPRKSPQDLRRWTLAEIRAHCLETVRGCWEWRTRPGVTPRTEHSQRYTCVKHGGQVLPLRRVAYALMFGQAPEGKSIVPARCNNQRCHNPAHCTPMTESQKGRLAAARGSFSTEQRKQAIAQAKQAASTTGMTLDKARQIRAITGRAEDHCAAFGISKSMFNRIRKNLAWKDACGE
jgi:hypothetical protein